MAAKHNYEAVKIAVQDIIAPQLEAVKGEISSLRIEIKRLYEKIGSSRNEIKADISRLDEKLLFTNKRLDEALEIRERLAVLEAKIGKYRFIISPR